MGTGDKIFDRQTNYDLLRIVSCIAVIFIHVSAPYISAYTGVPGEYDVCREHFWFANLCNVLSRFAVPCFVMLSGAFLLPQARNAGYRYFYGKSLRGVGIQTLIFSVLYFLYSVAKGCASIWFREKSPADLLRTFKNFAVGAPFYHMWYLYMLIGVYLLVPVVIRFRQSIPEEAYARVVWFFFAAAICSLWTSDHLLNWDIGQAFCYLAYFMVGDRLRVWSQKRKSNGKGICLIAMGLALETGMAWLRYQHILAGVEQKYTLVGPANPLIAMASLLIFAGFGMLTVRADFSKAAKYTFYIYLLHAGVWNILEILIKQVNPGWDNRIVICGCAAIVFAFSWLLSILYLKLWKKADQKWRVSDRLCSALHL